MFMSIVFRSGLSVTWTKQISTITIYECVVMFLCSFIKARGMIFEYFTYKQNASFLSEKNG